MAALLYSNGDGTATGRFAGNPFMDLMVTAETGDTLKLSFVDVLKSSVVASVKLTARPTIKGGMEFSADGCEWVVTKARKGKAVLQAYRRLQGAEASGDDLASLLGG